jgi:hypothetical protein
LASLAGGSAFDVRGGHAGEKTDRQSLEMVVEVLAEVGRRLHLRAPEVVLDVALGSRSRCGARRRGSPGATAFTPRPTRVNEPAFVEVMPLGDYGSGECVVEVEDRAGARLGIEVRGIDGAQFGALAGSFLRGES